MSKALDIYLERRKTRQYVGRLSRKKRKFVFEYDSIYLYSENPLAIGPDLPLNPRGFVQGSALGDSTISRVDKKPKNLNQTCIKRARHTSSELFPSFADRIPSRQNPAYEEYCQSVGISPLEKDPFVLLSTLGRKSPITPFVCELVQESQKGFSTEDLKGFRKDLGLSIREFASVFDVSQASIYRIENKKTTGRDTLKKLALYFQYPKIALDKVQNSTVLNERKKNQAQSFLQSQIQAYGIKSVDS